jgi:Fe-S-cluster-containing dehydrogenase component
MKQYYMAIDVSLCHDCNNCFLACKDEHVGNQWLPYTEDQPRHGHKWLDILSTERGLFPSIDVCYLPKPCQHCQDAPCIKAYPDCISLREDGIVLIDVNKARGVKGLVDSCPYGAIYWNEEANVAQKCTMCAHLLDSKDWEPGVPRCVHSCPTDAMKFYHMEPADFEKLANAEGFEGYRSAGLKSQPHVVYKNLFRYTKNFITAGVLVNGECFENATVTLKNKTGVLASQKTNYFGDFKFDALENGEYTVDIEAAGQRTSCAAVINSDSKNLGFIKLAAAAAQATAKAG